MIIRTIVLLSVFFCLSGFVGEKWKEFASKEGRFKILIPAKKLQGKMLNVDTELGKIQTHVYYYQPNPNKSPSNVFYQVTYTDYPEEIHKDSLDLREEFFTSTVESAVESVNGTLLYQSEHKLQGNKGWQWRVLIKDGAASIKTHAYLVGKRYYSVQVVTMAQNNLNPSIDRFLNSFRIVKEKEK